MWAAKEKLRMTLYFLPALFLLGNLIRLLQSQQKNLRIHFYLYVVFSAFPVIDFGCKESYKWCFCRLFLLHCICVISEGPTETWFQKVLLLNRGMLLVSCSPENSWLTFWSCSNYSQWSGRETLWRESSWFPATSSESGSHSLVCLFNRSMNTHLNPNIFIQNIHICTYLSYTWYKEYKGRINKGYIYIYYIYISLILI